MCIAREVTMDKVNICERVTSLIVLKKIIKKITHLMQEQNGQENVHADLPVN